MPSFKNLAIAAKRVRYGLTTPSEFLLSFVDSFTYHVFGKNFDIAGRKSMKRRQKEFFENNSYNIKGAKIPFLDDKFSGVFFNTVMIDTMGSYLYFDDKYDEKTLETLYSLHISPFSYKNDKIDVTVKSGDIVIDAGSWIGDFAAYASAKGAVVYAFEPMDETFKYLEQTAKLNKNITAVKKGISDEDVTDKTFFTSVDNTQAHTFAENRAEMIKEAIGNKMQTQKVATVSIDSFVQENNLKSVDFIKANIEGFERNLLKGAQNTLKNFAPKLALCCDHLPDDPEVLSALIKEANPKYNIIQKNDKLFASVPNK